MNCSKWERDIASDVESEGLRAHVAVCANCREYAREIEQNRFALSTKAIDPAAFDGVRRRVLDQIQAEKRRSAWWAWPAAVAACVALLVSSALVLKLRNPAPPRPVEFAKAPKLVQWTVPARVRSAPPRRARIVAHRDPLVVKMLTNDPDVIIVWLVDQKGDSL